MRRATDDSCTSYSVRVEPRALLPRDSSLARLADDELGVTYSSDIYGDISAVCSKA